MGCICAKEAAVREERDSPKRKTFRIGSRRFASGRLIPAADFGNAGNEKERERSKDRSKQNGIAISTTGSEDERKENQWTASEPYPRLSNPPLHVQGEQVAAGWPAWLSAVAGDAIKGWIPRRADSFEKLDKIGQGTYSNVYKARDLDTGKIVALKKVRFDNLEPESVRFMAREIQVLRRLDHPNVVKLEGLVTSRMSCSLYLVFEYMEHDLAGLAACPGITFTEPQVKCYLQQLLRGLEHCHNHGVLHRDIKGSNLLLDNEGILKIADFGLATFFHPDQKLPLTSRVITLWYRPPELLLGATEYGVAVDLWSTGCILAELLAGKPIMPGRTEVEQLHKIFKLCGSPSEEYWKKSKLPHATIFKPQQPYKRCISETYKDFPQSALASLETLLAIEPLDRGTAASALKSEFFTTDPLACDPSSLPKYPPSKELDAKIRDEEARRQRAAGGRVRGSEAVKRSGPANKAPAVPDANAELAASIQKRRLASHAAKSKSEKFSAKHEDSAVGFPIDPPRPVDAAGAGRVYAQHPAHSGPLSNPTVAAMGYKMQKEDDSRMVPPRLPPRSTKFVSVPDLKSQPAHGPQAPDLSSLSTLIAARNIEHTELQQSEMCSKGSEGLHLLDSIQRGRPAQGFSGQAQRMHFSGPLLHSSANLEDILGEHERQIRQAVRRAKHEKGKNQRSALSNKTWVNGANGNSEVMEAGNCYGPQPTSGGWWKSPRPRSSGEIMELNETDQGLSSVIEEREQET